MNEDLKVWDIVMRTEHSSQTWMIKGNTYTIKEIFNDSWTTMIRVEECAWKFQIWNFRFIWTTNWVVWPYPIMYNNILTPPSMNYFHTAVLIKKSATSTVTATYTQIEWTELEPYKVRTATSKEDLEKTLLRELDKSVDHNDVKFLINPIF